jgi:signal transduction histidine kinase
VTDKRLRFAPDILKRLGEELIPHPDQGIVELVRNAYDADAQVCTVTLENTDAPGGVITISDNGIGMTENDLADGWLVVGRSRKSVAIPTRRGRLPVGDKGLGRLAALRLGKTATVATRSQTRPGVELRLTLDWTAFAAAHVVEDVTLEITEHRTSQSHGTSITIRDLAASFGSKDAQRLARALVLLADPFDRKRGFRPLLRAPAFRDLELLVRKGYFDDAEYHLSASLTARGKASAVVRDRFGRIRWQGAHEAIAGNAKSYLAPRAKFELWMFKVGGKGFASALGVRLTDIRRWLETVGGVHIYHRGLRVHPYGDSGQDWLDMNLARARSPEERPSTNTSLGRVVVLDPTEQLLQKTDRSGFVENEAFEELRRFSKDVLEWTADQRTKERDARMEAEKRRVARNVTSARATRRRAVSRIPPKQRVPVTTALDALERARDREARVLREEVQLYRTLGTVGTTVAVFAHDSAKPVTSIVQLAGSLEQRGRQALGDRYDEILKGPVDKIRRQATALITYAKVPITLLSRDKRKPAEVPLNHTIAESVALFQPFFDDAGIQVIPDFSDGEFLVHGTVAAIESILSNLLTNAITALTRPEARRTGRRLAIATSYDHGRLVIRVFDNGPGVHNISTEDIWRPGKTTTPNGTGLGLTIVRDVVKDLGGRVTVLQKGELGGAEFVVELPATEGER